MIQFNIQFKMKSKIFIQKFIHSKYLKLFNKILYLKKLKKYYSKASGQTGMFTVCNKSPDLLQKKQATAFSMKLTFPLLPSRSLFRDLGHYLSHFKLIPA